MVDGDWQVTASANQRGAGAEIVETSAKAKDVTALQFASEIAYNKDGFNANGRNECRSMGSIKESKPYMRKRYNLLVHISQIKKLQFEKPPFIVSNIQLLFEISKPYYAS